jgi:hypothetical protein
MELPHAFTRSESDRGKTTHDRRGVVDVDKVILEVLTRRDVQYAIGILLGEVGQHIHLVGIHAAERDLDALHPGSIPQRLRTFCQVVE